MLKRICLYAAYAACIAMFIIGADRRGSFIETECGDIRSYYTQYGR